MEFMTSLHLDPLANPIRYGDKIMLTGSCFTEHIGNALAESKFDVLQNPNGILFDPVSVCKSLESYIDNKRYNTSDLFYLNEVWNSWAHHSRFSRLDSQEALQVINASQESAHHFLRQADWLIITLGSSFSHRLTDAALLAIEQDKQAGRAKTEEQDWGVANCHRAPAEWFRKHLLDIAETENVLSACIGRLRKFNPGLRIILTVSPVRHLRDGVIDNNRSKARLIEVVHRIKEQWAEIFYFPAYELVIDVLRDYRFFDIDFAHPNYQATGFVLEKFTASCIGKESRILMEEIRKIVIARKHRPLHPGTRAHRQFLANHLEKVKALQLRYPFLDLGEELKYFSEA